MDEFDPGKRIGLFVDEWGTWYDRTPGASLAYQQNTIRDALVAAVHLNIFMRHAERVRMTSIAQLANVLQAMVLTDRERMIVTPTYQVFKMYVPFQDATFLPVDLSASEYSFSDVRIPAVDVGAARAKDGSIRLALLNLDPHRSARVELSLPGISPRGAEGQILTASQMDAHNDFDHPNEVVPVKFSGRISGRQLVFDLAPKSVAVVQVAD